MKFQPRTAFEAASRRSGWPEIIFACFTFPSGVTVASTTTTPCTRALVAAGGYGGFWPEMNSTGLTLAPAASFSAGVVGVTERVGGVRDGVGGATASAVSGLGGAGAGEGGGEETG